VNLTKNLKAIHHRDAEAQRILKKASNTAKVAMVSQGSAMGEPQ